MKIKKIIIMLVVVFLLSSTIFNVFAVLTKPGNLVMSPKTSGNVTYYFNSFSVDEHWETDYTYISDGDEDTYGETDYSYGIHLLTGNTCPASTLGNITKVELRAKGYYTFDVPAHVHDMYIRPVFPSGDGDNHVFLLPEDTGAWSDWSDITNDTNAPSTWDWVDIDLLDCDLDAYHLAPSPPAINVIPYCSKVEIRVTYFYRQSFSVSWDMGTDADMTILVFKNNSTPDSIDDGYKYFLNDSYTNTNFSGVFHEGLAFNKNYSCLGFSGEYFFGKSTRNLEDGIPITFMDNSTDINSSYFTIDSSSKVNGTYSMNFSNPSATSGEIFGCRHFESNHTWDNFSIHCLIDTKDISTSDNALTIQPYNITNKTANITYHKEMLPRVNFTDTDYLVSDYNVTVGNQGLLNTWVINQVYNITYSIYGDFINVTIDDYNGNTGYVNESYNISEIDGFLVSMDRDVVRNAYLDDWVEVNASTITSTYASIYNWTWPSKPLSFSELGLYSTSVNLSWDANDSFYNWDKIHIQRSTTSYPTSPTDGTNIYNGSLLYYEENIELSTTVYYSAWGYGNESTFHSIDYATASHVSSPLRAYFSYHPITNINIDDTVSFTDSSVGEIVEWEWHFGDGTIMFGKNQDYSYDHIGEYRVTLFVTDANDNEDKYSKNIHISSSDNPYIPPSESPDYPSGYDILELYPVFNTDNLKIQEGKIRVVVIDTGYTSRIYRSIDMTTVQGYKLDEFSSVYDDNGHGTFCIYEIASLLQTKCPNAEIISFKVFDSNGVSTPEGFLDALDYVKQLDPDLVSISAGAFGNVNDPYSKKINELRRAGVVVLAAAAGNLGPDPSTILSPALSDSAIAVGSFNNMGTVDLSDDVINEWSSRGPVYGVSHKPDVAGIGESIIGPWMYSERVVSGTSMATPMITAGSAVVLAEHKELINIVKIFFFWDKSVIGQSFEDALKESCRKPANYDLDGGVNAWGAGVPDFALTSEIFYWKLIALLMIPILIIAGIVVALVYYVFVIRKR